MRKALLFLYVLLWSAGLRPAPLIWRAGVPPAFSRLQAGRLPATETYRIAFYNLENFFHPTHDTLKNDYDFTPTGLKGWGNEKFTAKRNHIFKVISALDNETPLLAMGVAEVENDRALCELCKGTPLRYLNFDYVHFESPDPRGIDVALLYIPDRLQIDTAYPIAVIVPPDTVSHTRDILYVRAYPTLGSLSACVPSACGPPGPQQAAGLQDNGARSAQNKSDSLCSSDGRAALATFVSRSDGSGPGGPHAYGSSPLHLFVVHFPSKYGGAVATEGKRACAARLLREKMEEIYSRDTAALIIAMGDFNTTPDDPALVPLDSLSFCNLMNTSAWKKDRKKGQAGGSHKFRETWSTIDHIILNRGAGLRTREINPAGQESRAPKAQIFDRPFLLIPDEKYFGVKPFRTFNGAQYLGGYSDHLPVYIDIVP